MPLRVDPVLLGLPPIKPVEPPAQVAKPAASAGQQGAAEVRTVEVPEVETRPVAPQADPAPAAVPAKALPAEPAAQAVVTSVTPPVTPVVPAPEPLRNDVSPAAGTPSPTQPAVLAKPVPPAPVQRPSVPSAAREKISTLEPLRVDPALLGLPPAAPAAQLAGRPGSALTPPLSTADDRTAASGADAGLRDEDEIADPSPALALRAASKMEPPPKDSAVPRPAFLSAQRMFGEVDREFVAEGSAELRKIGTVVNSDRLTYWPLDDELEAEGSVRLEQGEDVIRGPKLRLRLEDQVGYFNQPSYFLKRQPLAGNKPDEGSGNVVRALEQATQQAQLNSGAAQGMASLASSPSAFNQSPGVKAVSEARGQADRLDFEGENQFRLTNNTYTTCPVDNDGWYVRTDELKLDYDREVGQGKGATVYFQDVPILYSPWLSFSLNNQRKSGFLSPSLGTSSDSGVEYEQPYYWNIAPNMDATISPRLMTKRGVQLGNEFRYLNTGFGGLYSGKVGVEFLPGDNLRDGDNRYGIALTHNQVTGHGFSGLINYNKVSDDNYFTDLSSNVAQTSQAQLLQQGMLSYGSGIWSGSVNFQQYQTLQPDDTDPVLEQYRMLPQLTVNMRKPDFYQTDVSFLGQYTNFTIKEREQFGTIYPDGKRTVLYPQVALPYVRPGWYVTPKFGVNYRSYSLSGQAAGSPDSISVSLPVFSLDSGMTFERASNWFGNDYTQTLEPRLYYLNIPYKDQSKIPLFDTSLADFNFAQVFSENQFSGWDRVNNANQLTAAVTSRLIEPSTGNEIMRAMIGQRFYFSQSKVSLTGSVAASDTKWDRSDFLAAFSGQVLPRVFADAAVQFDPNDRRAERYSLGLRYQPEPGKVLNAAYRYNRDAKTPINQVDVSGQWPITGRWHGVGRMNYSFKDDGTVLSTGGQGGRVIESIAGLEYNGGCWVLRGVVRRQALTSADASTAFFIQLELNDFARIGSNPLSMLKRNIQGYSLINEQTGNSVFDD